MSWLLPRSPFCNNNVMFAIFSLAHSSYVCLMSWNSSWLQSVRPREELVYTVSMTVQRNRSLIFPPSGPTDLLLTVLGCGRKGRVLALERSGDF